MTTSFPFGTPKSRLLLKTCPQLLKTKKKVNFNDASFPQWEFLYEITHIVSQEFLGQYQSSKFKGKLCFLHQRVLTKKCLFGQYLAILKKRGWFRKILWPSQNIWNHRFCEIFVRLSLFNRMKNPKIFVKIVLTILYLLMIKFWRQKQNNLKSTLG